MVKEWNPEKFDPDTVDMFYAPGTAVTLYSRESFSANAVTDTYLCRCCQIVYGMLGNHIRAHLWNANYMPYTIICVRCYDFLRE